MSDLREKYKFDLRITALFRRMPDEVFEKVMQNAHSREIKKGKFLYREGEVAKDFFWCGAGLLEMFHGSDSNRDTVEIIGPRDFFSLMEIFDSQNYQTSAMALEDGEVICFDGASFKAGLEQNFDMLVRMLGSMSGALRGVVSEISDLKLKTTSQRLGTFLLGCCKEDQGQGHVVLSFDKKTLANRIGMKPETLSRSIASLKSVGVKTTGDSFQITDIKALRSYCGEWEADEI